MPTYPYRCPNGHFRNLVFRFGKSKPQVKCHCGRHMTRQFVVPTIYYRGPGFTKGGYDYMEEARTGRNFDQERKEKEYYDTRDELDEHLDKAGLDVFKDKLQFTRSPVPDAV